MTNNYSFEEYQKDSRKTVAYSAIGHMVIYPTLGLAGEAGEVAEKIKKVFRDDNGIFTPEHKEMIRKELGDVLWYVAQICTELDLNLEDVAKHNIEKLKSRKINNNLHGSGDLR
ncbi:MAG: putative pyrophosphatase [Candidatus Nomurabacteria bacterium GW2011_GWB1_37_5]|uniref:Putative pyrophosphatase n=1 Tax=Candidatus Nomurabacteria bacterium GW2011_GWB1_37_5 TaxID=1618742 RepID=A0A0G0GY99_9BACT|nr:MAG: putative pyrophosphatase [Candidatus Nomurabacteria bacterium GW2011_GWB1_37_5]